MLPLKKFATQDTLTATMFCSTNESLSAAASVTASATSTCASTKTVHDYVDDDSSDNKLVLSKASLSKKLPNNKAAVSHAAHYELNGRCMMISAPPPKVLCLPKMSSIMIKGATTVCGRVGKYCLNQHYGRYCIAVLYCYFHNNRYTLTLSERMVLFRPSRMCPWTPMTETYSLGTTLLL